MFAKEAQKNYMVIDEHNESVWNISKGKHTL